MTRPERQAWMGEVEVSDVWGVGQRIHEPLAAIGFHTLLDQTVCIMPTFA